MKLYFHPILVMLLLTLVSCGEKTELGSEPEVSEEQPPATTVKDTQDQLKEATDNANNPVEENLEEDIKSSPSAEGKDQSPKGEGEDDILPEEKEKQEAEMIDEEEEYEPMPTD